MKNKSLADKLKELRLAHSYKQVDVAAIIGVVRQTYSHYERGSRKPSAEILYKLAAFYDIPVNELLRYTTELDPELFFDAPIPQDSSIEHEEFIEYLKIPKNRDRLKFFSNTEKRLLYYFEKLNATDQWELVEISRIKTMKENYKTHE